MLIMINTLPVISGCFVFADSNTDEWTTVTSNQELADAFRVYCKSRNLVIDGSVLDAVTSVTTDTFNSICNTLGIDVTALQAHIKYKTDGNQGLQWLFDDTGISAYNRIFAEFLQNNDLEVGDTVEDTIIKSGIWFTDLDGNGCYVYVGNSSAVGSPLPYQVSSVNNSNPILEYGTPYVYDTNYFIDLYNSLSLNQSTTRTYHLINNLSPTITYKRSKTSNGVNERILITSSINSVDTSVNNFSNGTKTSEGCQVIITDSTKTRYFFGTFSKPYNNYQYAYLTLRGIFEITNPDTQNGNVYITTNNFVINNNFYEGDTIINNNGTPVEPDPEPDPPIGYDPYPDGGGTVTNPVNPSDPNGGDNIDINFPDIDIDLPEIDWSIGDLSHKFPFSIPFDLYNMFSILNVEPQTPEIRGTINLGIYQWPIEWDLHQFDNTAELLRNVEFVGFVIGLIFITRNIIKG